MNNAQTNVNCYAIYARTSKDTDDAFSVASQVDAALNYARNNGFYVPDDYIFREDFTGKAFDRPEYKRIRELIKARQIRGLIIYATDRFARKVSVGEIYLDELFQYDVALHNISWGQALRNTPEDRLRFNFETTFSSFERDKIIERVTRGKARKAESGKIICANRPPYGYDFNEYKNGFVLNQWAPYVKELLEDFALRHIPWTAICDSLNARHIPTPGMLKADHLEDVATRMLKAELINERQFEEKMKNVRKVRGYQNWTFGTIQTLLKNLKTYTGDYQFFLKGVEYHAEVPPIISQETAKAIEQMVEMNKTRFARKSGIGSEKFLMARRLTCAVHKCAFGARASQDHKYIAGYYACQHYRYKGIKQTNTCAVRPVRQDVLDPLVRQFIRELLLHPEALFKWWEEQNKNDEATNANTLQEIDVVNYKISETESKYFRTLDRLTDRIDAIERAYYEQERDRLKGLVSELKERRAELEGSLIKVTVAPETIQTLKEMGEQYRTALETSFDIKFWRGLVEDLDLMGEIGLDEEKGPYIDFILFGEKRVRKHFELDPLKRGPKTEEGQKTNTPSDSAENGRIHGSNYGHSLFNHGSRTRAAPPCRADQRWSAARAC